MQAYIKKKQEIERHFLNSVFPFLMTAIELSMNKVDY